MANALTHIVALKEGVDVQQLLGVVSQSQGAIDRALKEIGTVHDFRFVFFDGSQPNLQPTATSTGPFALGLITTYDGAFDAYIQDFTRYLAPMFDTLLAATVGGEALVPVKDHLQEFTEWIRRNDAAQQPPNNQFQFSTAYPYTVQQILAAGS